jgi:hypothetical protein
MVIGESWMLAGWVGVLQMDPLISAVVIVAMYIK